MPADGRERPRTPASPERPGGCTGHEWISTLRLATGLMLTLSLYRFGYDHGILTVDGLLGSIAATGGFLMGLSLGLTPASRWFALPRRWLSQRRALGLSGYGCALTYTAGALATTPERYLQDFPLRLLTPDSLLGILAMIILTAMATLSNRAAIARLGVRGWKRFMRLGYVAYLALVVRAALLEGDVWLTWLADPVWLPPPRLLLSMFATMVLLSRLALAIGPAAMLDCRRPGR